MSFADNAKTQQECWTFWFRTIPNLQIRDHHLNVGYMYLHIEIQLEYTTYDSKCSVQPVAIQKCDKFRAGQSSSEVSYNSIQVKTVKL